LATQRFVGAPSALRNAAHRVSDVVYQKILGVRGAFATRIAYVAVEGAAPEQHFQLIVADADGANQHLVLESRFPLMSPAWSPDGQYLAYVSFETKHSGVYVQRVKSGERRQVSARAGVNGAPEWSPDGRKLALTLGGGGGNPDIYILDLTTQDLTRITDDPAIDTEPVWAPDGRSLYFTSDRAGSPQVYQINAQPGAHPKRITFGGTYNARPRVSPDGTQLAMVSLDNAAYRIAVQDLSMRRVIIVLVAAAALTLGGCAAKQPKPAPPAPGETSEPAQGAGAGTASAAAANPDDEAMGPQAGLLATRLVYFDFDSAEIKGAGTDVVAAHAKYLGAHAATRVRLEGPTDERGSREYNTGLAGRRAPLVSRAAPPQG